MKQQSKPARAIFKQYEACCIMLYASFGIGLLVDLIINIPLGLAIGYTNSLLENLIYFGATWLALFVLSYRDGRQNYQFKLGRLSLCLFLTLATQVVLVLIIGHAIYLSGPAIVFDDYALNVFNPISVRSYVVSETYKWILMFAADLLVYVPTMILGEYLGARKHNKEFENYKET